MLDYFPLLRSDTAKLHAVDAHPVFSLRSW